MSKTCTKCGEHKSAEFFSPCTKGKGGLHSWCKACLAALRRQDRKADPLRYRAIDKARHKRHGAARRANYREWWLINADKLNQRARIRRQVRGMIYNASRRSKAEGSPELRAQKAEANRAWRVENQESIKLRRKEAWRQKRPAEKLNVTFSATMSRSLKRGSKGGRSWKTLLGYTVSDLRRHLERQFLRGMSWENYGTGWHIDHIVPRSAFFFSSPDDDEFKACWALTNLRPLWALDNIRKRDSRLMLL